jgi:hypothetical protein
MPCACPLLQEWLHYVDQEKAARLAIETRVAQMAEDAAGLREWAVMQVGGWGRGGVGACVCCASRAWPSSGRTPGSSSFGLPSAPEFPGFAPFPSCWTACP